jgi:hypothetical protein
MRPCESVRPIPNYRLQRSTGARSAVKGPNETGAPAAAEAYVMLHISRVAVDWELTDVR